MNKNARPDCPPQTSSRTAPSQNPAYGASAAASIEIVCDSSAEWSAPGVLKQRLLFQAAAILACASLVSGGLSILYDKGLIRMESKDFLVGIIYFMTLGGALHLSGKLGTRRAALLAGNTVVFQAWNTVFFSVPPIGAFVVVLGLWVPVYWTLTDPETMERLGLGAKGFAVNFLTGLALAAALTAYLSWGMSNFGFTFKIELWRLTVNAAQVLPMYAAIFSLLFMVWNRLKEWGLSPAGLLIALAILSVSLNVPTFACVAAATNTSPATALAGFTAVTVIMILSMHFTFGKFRSAIPAACLFTALADLLIMTGLT